VLRSCCISAQKDVWCCNLRGLRLGHLQAGVIHTGSKLTLLAWVLGLVTGESIDFEGIGARVGVGLPVKGRGCRGTPCHVQGDGRSGLDCVSPSFHAKLVRLRTFKISTLVQCW
jgi:hypothetical protein